MPRDEDVLVDAEELRARLARVLPQRRPEPQAEQEAPRKRPPPDGAAMDRELGPAAMAVLRRFEGMPAMPSSTYGPCETRRNRSSGLCFMQNFSFEPWPFSGCHTVTNLGKVLDIAFWRW